MRNKVIKIIILCLVLSTYYFVHSPSKIEANKFEDEIWWTNYCSTYISQGDTNKKNDCMEYQNYLSNKKSTALSSASDIQGKLDKVKGDIDELGNLAKSLNDDITLLNNQIKAKETAILELESNIKIVESNISEKETNVVERKEIIKNRMVEIQLSINSNEYLDFIMGAENLVDMIQRAESMKTITEYDNLMISKLDEEVLALETDKEEKERIQDTLDLEKKDLENSRTALKAKEEENIQLIALYQKQEADLLAQKNEFQAAARTADENMPSLQFGDGNSVPEINTTGWITNIIPGSYYSAGTWSYPDGGVHLGMDMAAPIGTPIYAPADAIVLYANNPAPSNGGYLGNWSGTPIGGGNTVFLLMSVNGETYAVSFAHMSQNGMNALGKAKISQGEVIGLTGNSGNSTGPHCHVEVYKLNISVQQAVQVWNSTRDWTFGTGWGSSGAGGTSKYGQRIRPESIFKAG